MKSKLPQEAPLDLEEQRPQCLRSIGGLDLDCQAARASFSLALDSISVWYEDLFAIRRYRAALAEEQAVPLTFSGQ